MFFKIFVSNKNKHSIQFLTEWVFIFCKIEKFSNNLNIVVSWSLLLKLNRRGTMYQQSQYRRNIMEVGSSILTCKLQPPILQSKHNAEPFIASFYPHSWSSVPTVKNVENWRTWSFWKMRLYFSLSKAGKPDGFYIHQCGVWKKLKN